jgi:hypothetical protein
VRVVHSWFASTDDWDKQFESVEKGWPAFFRILNRYLSHFRGQSCTQVQLMAFTPGTKESVWDALARPLGLAGAGTGQSVTSTGDAPRFAAMVEYVSPKANPELTLALEQPTPGTAHVSVMAMGDQVYVYICLYLYGDAARAVAAREEPVWQAWLGRLFPAPVGQPDS